MYINHMHVPDYGLRYAAEAPRRLNARDEIRVHASCHAQRPAQDDLCP